MNIRLVNLPHSILGVLAALLCLQFFGPILLLAQAHSLEIDFRETNGSIRPLHGVNSGPLCYRGTVDLSTFHRELGIPLTRLHDVVWLNAEAVDIHTIFPDLRNDPALPENYRFAATDDYIQAIIDVGSQIVYRLGESIEHTPRKYHVEPPADFDKWAAVSVGIIRHYNEGWANGFHHNIQYWEIWNEPDIGPYMWTGTEDQFLKLYETAAKAIKTAFPNVKVGGPAFGGLGDFDGTTLKPSNFLTHFLTLCRERQVPLDFFTWHRYTSQPWDLPVRAHALRQVLDGNGFSKTESHLNEWNYLPNDDWHPLRREGQGKEREEWFRQMTGLAGAAFDACALMLLQDAPVDAANFYTGEIQGFGLFDFNGIPKPNFYAFKAFHLLLDTPVRPGLRGVIPGELAALAGVDAQHTRGAVLVSNFKSADNRVMLTFRNSPWPAGVTYETLLLDETHRLVPVAQGTYTAAGKPIAIELPAPSVALVKFAPQSSSAAP